MEALHGVIEERGKDPDEAARKFRGLFERLRRKYDLEKHEYWSIYENRDDMVEIWIREGEKRKFISRVRRKDIRECYEIAILDLKFYDSKMCAAADGNRA